MSDKDILEKMLDLHKQATTEHSHHYTASVLQEAMLEIAQLRQLLTVSLPENPNTINYMLSLLNREIITATNVMMETKYPDLLKAEMEKVHKNASECYEWLEKIIKTNEKGEIT